jgi:hypothetical protein
MRSSRPGGSLRRPTVEALVRVYRKVVRELLRRGRLAVMGAFGRGAAYFEAGDS